MTRMWLIDPVYLCRQHLLGEHNELHKVVGHIVRGNLRVVKGHARKKQIDTSRIRHRHYELVQEMEERGYHHHSPLDYEDRLHLGEVNIRENIEDLKTRCASCRKRLAKASDPL